MFAIDEDNVFLKHYSSKYQKVVLPSYQIGSSKDNVQKLHSLRVKAEKTVKESKYF